MLLFALTLLACVDPVDHYNAAYMEGCDFVWPGAYDRGLSDAELCITGEPSVMCYSSWPDERGAGWIDGCTACVAEAYAAGQVDANADCMVPVEHGVLLIGAEVDNATPLDDESPPDLFLELGTLETTWTTPVVRDSWRATWNEAVDFVPSASPVTLTLYDFDDAPGALLITYWDWPDGHTFVGALEAGQLEAPGVVVYLRAH